MHRLFRRKKKEKKEDPIDVEKPQEVYTESTLPEEITSEIGIEEPVIFEKKEKPFEEKFVEYTRVIAEPLVESEQEVIEKHEMYPAIESIFYQNDSVFGFISPKIFSKEQLSTVQETDAPYPILHEELPPVSLEERIEGALFSVGRPIHANEIIENFAEESPTIKRAIRKLSRKRKRTSAIVIEEISKDRWVMELNPLFHEFFQSLEPELFLLPDERRIVTEIAYRQPISLALVKKLVTGIGPIKIAEICNKLEELGFITSEKRARSILYTSTSKFAKSFGFDFESRRLKLQMLWRLKRLMGDYEEEPEDLEEEEDEEQDKEEVIEQTDETSPAISQPLDQEITVIKTESEAKEAAQGEEGLNKPPERSEESISDFPAHESLQGLLQDDVPEIKPLEPKEISSTEEE